MIHLGDITKMHGDAIPPVDCITGGSPCQDLSVAGKRAGLEGERSGLFMEQIRIVKEMRERDRRAGRTDWAVRPRFMVWENVPGAFSSNGGKDFQAVLTEIVKIVEPDAPDVPLPDKGKWPKAGCLYDDMGRWSIAWRLHDAQFWGVPQRRKRIALVADFGGLAAPEVLFEREGLSRYSEPSGAEGKGAAAATRGGSKGTSYGFEPGAAKQLNTEGRFVEERAPTLRAEMGDNQVSVAVGGGVDGAISFQERAGKPGGGQSRDAVFCLQGNGIDRADTAGCNGRGWREDQSYTLNTIDRPAVFDARGNGDVVTSSGTDVADTLDASYYKGTGSRNGKERTVVCVGNGQLNQMSMAEQANELDTMHDQQAVMIAASLSASDYKGQRAQDLGNNMANYPIQNSFVRRLTPTECERLQGYPDGWTDIGDWVDSKGKKHKAADSPRYKALGNSIALPFWFWLLRRISAQYERPATLGSLFDGIGGFPLCWERCNGPGTAIWASEIEEFPIAVTKKHFQEEKEDA